MEIYTIGFTRSSAEHFFTRLADAGVQRVLDIRLNNTSQLAGFAKAADLPYLLRELIGASYEHELLLAPTQELLGWARGKDGDWLTFERRFRELIAERRIEHVLDPGDFDVPTALLCSEPTTEHCHRRFVTEHLAEHWSGVGVTHL
jgi:uncharacterized protein (DUF488 family)